MLSTQPRLDTASHACQSVLSLKPRSADEGGQNRGVNREKTMKMIKLFACVFATTLLVSLAPAQELSAPSTAVYVLNSEGGSALQYNFQEGATVSFFATKQRTSYGFSNSANTLEIQTVNGVTELNVFENAKGACNAVSGTCSYFGTFTQLRMDTVTNSDGSSYIIMTGDLVGSFTDYRGTVYPNTVAHYYTETYPATDGITVGGPAGLTIVLSYN